MKYIKKPVVIDAMQYVGQADLTELKNWVETFGVEFRTFFNADAKNEGLSVNTLEGTMNVSVGDYIIRGLKGEFYPCKPDIFDLTYDVVLGENLPEIYNQFTKTNPENVILADRIAGKVDLYGNEIDLSKQVIEPQVAISSNDFIARRIAGEVDEQGNEILKETESETENFVLDEVGPIVNSILESNEVSSPMDEKKSITYNSKGKSKKKKK